ncbi:histone H1-like repetitive region-containing protein [Actinomadura sp. NAK00032]|uniref:histone H1-like repetitive region-containing protein n=1 Tax=Actinomadura sp. NAK00032 TaxID=2742128 RepID=UPI0034A49938
MTESPRLARLGTHHAPDDSHPNPANAHRFPAARPPFCLAAHLPGGRPRPTVSHRGRPSAGPGNRYAPQRSIYPPHRRPPTPQPSHRPTATRRTTARHSAARHSAARHSAARHSAARHSAARHSAARRTAGHRTADRRTAARPSAARPTAARPTAARRTTGRRATARRSTARRSTARRTAGQRTAARRAAGRGWGRRVGLRARRSGRSTMIMKCAICLTPFASGAPSRWGGSGSGPCSCRLVPGRRGRTRSRWRGGPSSSASR